MTIAIGAIVYLLMASIVACVGLILLGLPNLVWKVGVSRGTDIERFNPPERAWEIWALGLLFGLGVAGFVLAGNAEWVGRALGGIELSLDRWIVLGLSLPLLLVGVFAAGVLSGRGEEQRRREAGCGYCATCRRPLRGRHVLPDPPFDPAYLAQQHRTVHGHEAEVERCGCYCTKCAAAVGILPDDDN